MRLVLGIDGGGSRTRAALCDTAGNLLGVGFGGPSNIKAVGMEQCLTSLDAARNHAFRSADMKPGRVASVFIGLAGFNPRLDLAVLGRLEDLNWAPQGCLGLNHDIFIALEGGLLGQPGLAIIAGTGSSLFGRNARGRELKLGGWGFLLGDAGSGYSLTINAVRATLHRWEQGLDTSHLDRCILDAFKVRQPEELIGCIYSEDFPRDRVAGFARVVVELAAGGDTEADELLHASIQELCSMVSTAQRRLELPDDFKVIMTGGLFEAYPYFMTAFLQVFSQLYRRCEITEPVLPPTAGAVLQACKQVGEAITDELVDNLIGQEWDILTLAR
ncbi:MAG: BadF/BadG/BcrA/BcrD ATPase family protein [Opitutales bacterium]